MNSNFNSKHSYRDLSYKAPSKSANSHDNGSCRSQVNLGKVCDETWPLDEVINKIELKSDSDDEYNYNRNIQSWTSGPQLISETYNTGRDMKRFPGDGRVFSAFHEGSKTWKNTSVRHHQYNSKRGTQFDLSDKYSTKDDHSLYDSNNNYLDDDLSDSSIEDDSPTLRDVAIQCNLKRMGPLDSSWFKSEPPVVTQKPPIKVIKSSNNGVVSAYSDVPRLASPKPPTGAKYRPVVDNLEDRSSEWNDSDTAIYSQVDKRNKARNANINIVYKQPLNESFISNRSNSGKQYNVKSKEYGFSAHHSDGPKVALHNPNYSESTRNIYNGSYKDPKSSNDKEILEETISISNASSEESYRPVKYNDNYSITSKSSSNYRRGSPARNFTHEKHVKQPYYGTIEKSRDVKGKNRNKSKVYDNDENVLLANNSLRLKSSKSPYTERLYKSNADLRDQFLGDETRGGLAAAYRQRQQQQQQQQPNSNRQRTHSLNRMNGVVNESDHSPQLPARYLSQSHLNNTSSRLSDTGSSYQRIPRSMQHERDPIVMYIPTANHQKANESQKLTSILRNNSTKSNATLQSKGKKSKDAKSQSKLNLKERASEKAADKKKADLNRRHSMPKDTKFNWLSKFKLKSK